MSGNPTIIFTSQQNVVTHPGRFPRHAADLIAGQFSQLVRLLPELGYTVGGLRQPARLLKPPAVGQLPAQPQQPLHQLQQLAGLGQLGGGALQLLGGVGQSGANLRRYRRERLC